MRRRIWGFDGDNDAGEGVVRPFCSAAGGLVGCMVLWHEERRRLHVFRGTRRVRF